MSCTKSKIGVILDVVKKGRLKQDNIIFSMWHIDPHIWYLPIFLERLWHIISKSLCVCFWRRVFANMNINIQPPFIIRNALHTKRHLNQERGKFGKRFTEMPMFAKIECIEGGERYWNIELHDRILLLQKIPHLAELYRNILTESSNSWKICEARKLTG